MDQHLRPRRRRLNAQTDTLRERMDALNQVRKTTFRR